MKISRLAIFIAILLSVFYVGSEFIGNRSMARITRACVIPFLIIYYVLEKRYKSKYFLVFLITFSISYVLPLLRNVAPNNMLFILANIMCIIGYLAMIFEISMMIFQNMSFKKLLVKYPLYIIVFVALGAILARNVINMPRESINNMQIVIGNIYIGAIFTLLGVSFLNYIIRYTKKALYLFIGSICLAFSEVLQIANFYMFNEPKLAVVMVYLILQIAGFYLFFKQAFIQYYNAEEITAN